MAKTIEVEKDDLIRTIVLLDAAQDALDAAANLERRREAGKTLRNVTAQQRAEKTREHVQEMAAKYNVSVDW